MTRGAWRLPGAAVVVASLLVLAALLVLVWLGPTPRADAWIERASQSLQAGASGEARTLAQRALRSDPVGHGALVVLAAAAEADGDTDAALALHQRAAARSRREQASHAWLAVHYGASGQVEAALDHVDTLLRSRGALREQLFPALAGLLDDPRGVDLLSAQLALQPGWRGPLLAHFGRHAADADALVRLYRALEQGPAPATHAELAPLLQRLVADGREREAWLLFVAALDPPRIAALGNLFNADFAHPSTGLPFDWRVGRVAGAAVDFVEGVDDEGRRGPMLRLEFMNRRVPFRHLEQLLVLDPGHYQLQGRVRLESLRNERGLQWVLRCADDARVELARSERFSGTRAWSRFGTAFSVPDQGCQAQWLRLELPARIDPERQISGRLWFDGLRVTRDGSAGG